MNTFDDNAIRRIADTVRKSETMAWLAMNRRKRDYFGGGTGFKHMFKVESTDGASGNKDSFTVRPGIWSRCGKVNASSHINSTVFDPIDDWSFSATYTGILHAYCLLLDSSGGTEIANDFDMSNDSSDYDHSNDGTNGLQIIYSETEITEHYFGQFLHIADVVYASGVITEVIQSWIGAFKDAGLNYEYDGRHFAWKCIFDGAGGAGESDFTLYTNAGDWKRRGTSLTAVEVSATRTDIDAAGSCYALITPDVGDPSLDFYDLNTVWAAGFPSIFDYTSYYRKLAYVTNTTVYKNGGTVQYLPNSIEFFHHGGYIEDDWNRPDGQDGGYTGIDAATPKGKTIGFVPAGAHKGESEDYNFYTDVLISGAYTTGDQIINWWEHTAGGTDLKAYAKLDAVNPTASGKSLEIVDDTPDYMQVLGFYGSDKYDFAYSDNLASTPGKELSWGKPITFGDKPSLATVPTTELWKNALIEVSDTGQTLQYTLGDVNYSAPTFDFAKGSTGTFDPLGSWLSGDPCSDLSGCGWTDFDCDQLAGCGCQYVTDCLPDHDDMPNDTQSSGSLVTAEGHDGRYFPNTDYDEGPDTKDYETSGSVMAASLGIYDAINNDWDSDSLDVEVTGGIDLSAGTTIDLDATGNFGQSGADWSAQFTGDIDMDAVNIVIDASGNFYLTGDEFSLTGTNFGGTVDLDSAAGSLVANFSDGTIINGTTGLTLPTWTDGGFLLDGSVQTYSIRTMDLNTGLDVDIEVLGIAL